jgi:hypothetical protein
MALSSLYSFMTANNSFTFVTTFFRDGRKGKFTKLVLILTNNKWPLGIDPGGHHFAFLNVSINSKPIFILEVVLYKND